MFLNLYRLYRKNGYSDRSPLEDFNTEVFAGILNLSNKIFNDFINLLELPEDNYEVRTQRRYSLKGRPDCIIDLILIGENNICFIENKVHSGESWEQLDRYCEALDTHFKDQQKHLVYCTKFTDHKSETRHKFKQIRWYQIAEILRRYSENDFYLNNYLEFLKHFNMAQKNTFNPEMVISMENIKDAVETIKIHVENARPYFEDIFNLDKSSFQEATTSSKDRVAGYTTNILPEHTAHTEILYCIKVSLVKLQTQIFINKAHSSIEEVKEKIEAYIQTNAEVQLGFREHPMGFVIYMDRKIYDLINDPEADEKIKLWFVDSFNEFAKFLKATPEIGWRSNLLKLNIFDQYNNYLLSEDYRPSTIDLYVLHAKQNIQSDWKDEEWSPLDIYTQNVEYLLHMRSLTFGNQGPNFKGKQSFRQFLNNKIDKLKVATDVN